MERHRCLVEEVIVDISTRRRASDWESAGLLPAADRPRRRRHRHSNSRLSKMLERNAQWVAEARHTPPLCQQDVA
jgi:hypothetical protein